MTALPTAWAGKCSSPREKGRRADAGASAVQKTARAADPAGVPGPAAAAA
jgi:hypothetical protein